VNDRSQGDMISSWLIRGPRLAAGCDPIMGLEDKLCEMMVDGGVTTAVCVLCVVPDGNSTCC